jgi:hypothetical protein
MNTASERLESYAATVGKFCGLVDALEIARRINDREWLDETITKLIDYMHQLDRERGE